MFAARTFFGSRGAKVLNPLPGGTVDDIRIYPTSATATLFLNADGSVSCNASASLSTPVPQWFDPVTAGIGSSYWVNTTFSGTPPSGPLSTWVSLSAGQSWSLTALNAVKLTTLTIQIATDAAGANVVASGSYTLYAESTP